MNIECPSCGYKMKKDHIPKACPYCGKEGMVEAKSAQDLIDQTLHESGIMSQERKARQ